MRIALICPSFKESSNVLPPRGGFERRIFHLASYLNEQKGSSRIFSVGRINGSRTYHDITEETIKMTKFRPEKLGLISKAIEFAPYLLFGRPFSELALANYDILLKRVKKFNPDLIDDQYCSGLGNISMKLSKDLMVPRIATVIDLQGMILYRKLLKTRFFSSKKLGHYVIFKFLKRETQTCIYADHIIASTNIIKKILLSLGFEEKKISVIPDGLDIDYFRKFNDMIIINSIRERFSLNKYKLICIFIGQAGNPQNDQAASDIINVISKKVPSVAFFLIGKKMKPRRVRNCFVIGEVEDTRPYLMVSDIGLSPISIGGIGGKIKVLEYLASNKPVITTPMGIEGIEGLGREKGIIIQKEISKIHENIIDFINDHSLLEEYSYKASSTAQNYDYKIMGAKYLDVLKKIQIDTK